MKRMGFLLLGAFLASITLSSCASHQVLTPIDRNMKAYDITHLVEFADGKRLIAFDSRYNSVMLIEPEIVILKVTPVEAEVEAEAGFVTSCPDGLERDYWLYKLGVITGDELDESAHKAGYRVEGRELWQLLEDEFE